MSGSNWLQLVLLIVLLLVTTRVLGSYLAAVFGGERAPGDRFLLPVERLLYRACGIDPSREQTWPVYAFSVLAFSAVSVLFLYGLQRLQGSLPLNPTNATGVPPALAFNTAISFVTNTNWQNYGGELTMSHLTQMAGLTVQNFLSAAVGLAVAIALVRGLIRRRSATIGNFWVDVTRGTTRVLLPLAIVFALILVSQGVVQNLHGFTHATTLSGATQSIPGGPIASQEAIKELGTNGGGPYNANSAHPFENPTGFTNFMQILALLCIPFALTYTYGRLVKNQRQGWAVFAAMFAIWIAATGLATGFEEHGNPGLVSAGAVGGNYEGKEMRFGIASSAVFAASTTGTSTGAVDCMHDSLTPIGGMLPMIHMKLGEVSPGGVGVGLAGMLINALMAVFIAGLMVGRTPEFLGKKIQAAEMKLVVLYIIAMPLASLTFAAASVVLKSALPSLQTLDAHGLSEVLYNFASAANNNGSAFGYMNTGTQWYTVTMGIAMLIGRFFLIIPALAVGGSLAGKPKVPETSGTLPTHTPLFSGLLFGVIVIIAGLTFFPAVALGPIVEHLSL